MKTLCAVLFILLASSISAEDVLPAPRPYQGELVPPGTLTPAYNAPAGIHVNRQWNFSIDGSFVYWQARQRGLDFGYVIPKDPNTRQGQNLYSHFDFHPGFQIGIGMDIQYDGWAGFATYARLRTKESISSGLPSWGLGIEPLWLADTYNNGTTSGPAITQVVAAKETWNFHYDMVDFGLNRPAYTGRSLILAPHAGFRVGLIRERLLLLYNVSGAVVSNTLKQMNHLLGPRMGIGGKYLFGYGLRLEGSSAISFLYQVVNSYMKRANFSSPSTIQSNMHDRFRFFAPSMDMTLGLGWGSYFTKRSWYFDLSLSYDIHYYWHQNWMRHLKDSLDQRVTGEAADLAVQGWTGTVKFNF